MDVRSLGLRTDLMVRRLAGSQITDHGDHLVVRTPDNPGFYWGNFLGFPAPMRPGDADRWQKLFARHHPTARHRAYAVDDSTGAIGDPGEVGRLQAQPDVSAVLTASAPLEPVDAPAAIRAVRTDQDWQQAFDVRMSCFDGPPNELNTQFTTRHIAEARRLSATGGGSWFGAVVDGRIVATLGIVSDGGGVARYQSVETDPAYRRRGLARALLLRACEHAVERLGAHTLVIVADPGYHAVDLYRSVGFREAEKYAQFEAPPPEI